MQLSLLETPVKNAGFEDEYLRSQLITYIGNKRALISFIDGAFREVRSLHSNPNPRMMDMFAGSGVVSRLMKLTSSFVWSNDIELYSRIANRCFLTNPSTFNEIILNNHISEIQKLADHPIDEDGFVRRLYAPQDPDNIGPGERVFYTVENAKIIDTCAPAIIDLPEPYRSLIMGPFLSACSRYVNTSGVFKGFYKNKDGIGQYGGTMRNALQRILRTIEIEAPVLVERPCESMMTAMPAEKLVQCMDEVDIVYMDPPYNQHPYGSNYFMLNAIATYEEPSEISRVSGIPKNWNRSAFNKRGSALTSMETCVRDVKAKSVVISYNSEGFISPEEMEEMLQRYGELSIMSTDYPTFRGCRNLRNRDKSVTEFIFLLEKR